MKRFGRLIFLLLLAVLGAWLWNVIASDPGKVFVVIRGYSIETTVVVAVVALFLAGTALWALIGAIRFPLRFWHRHRRHRARECLACGLVALHEGRWRRAEKLLERAARERQHRLPALLGAARAAQARGDDARAQALLVQAAEGHDSLTVALLTARQHQRKGQATAITALFDTHPVAALPPRALELYLLALVETGRAGEAVNLLPALRNSHVLEGEALVDQEASILAAALQQASGNAEVETLWSGLSRAQKSHPRIVAAYARRAMKGEQAEAAVTVVEKALRKHWAPELVSVYGLLPRNPKRSPLKMAEAWLEEHPDDPVLLLTLGRLCRNEQLWGKAIEYLQQALEKGASAQAWEELGHVHAAQHQDAAARKAYAKALALGRQEATEIAEDRPVREIIAIEAVGEIRSSMGVPLLPQEAELRPAMQHTPETEHS